MRRCGAEPPGTPSAISAARRPSLLTRERARGIRTPDRPADLRALLGMDPPAAAARLEVRATTAYRNCQVLAVEVNTAKQVWAPAWLFLPKRDWTRLLLVIEPNGRNGAWHEDELYDQLAGAGIAVCAADVRGVGDLEAQFGPGAAGYARSHSTEENYAWASLILGRSLLGQRTTDIVALAQALALALSAGSHHARRSRQNDGAGALRRRAGAAYREDLSRAAFGIVAQRGRVGRLFVPARQPGTERPADHRPAGDRTLDRAAHRNCGGAIDGAGRLLPRGAVPYTDYREQPSWDFDTLSRL